MQPIMKLRSIIILFALAGTAQAQRVYKCTDAAGNTVYQSNGCQYTTDASGQAATAPSVQPAAGAQTPRRATAQPDRRDNDDDEPATAGFHYNNATQTGRSPRYYSVDACGAAKSRRREAFEKLGPSRTENATRFYDDAVRRACSGSGNSSVGR